MAGKIPQADIVKWRIPDAAILSGTLGGLRQIGAVGDPNAADEAILAVNVSGPSFARLGGRDVALNARNAILMSNMEEGFGIDRPAPVSFLGLRLPRKVLTQICPSLDDEAVRFIGAQSKPCGS